MNDSFMKEKPVLPLILSMALPMVVSMLVNSLYNIVDSFFVAQISEQAMTALSLVYPVQNLINAVAIGFGVGINAVIAYHLGARQQENASMAATHGTALSALHGLVLTAVCIPLMPWFLGMFTDDRTVIELGSQYAGIAFSFSVVIMVSLSFEKIYQAAGRMKETMLALLSGCITNIVLDPMLIFGIGPFPQMGIRGAALATGIGQVVTLVIYLVIYRTVKLPLRLGRSYLRPNARLDKKLYAIGIPATLNLALPSLLISALNAMLAAFSQAYVVILGIYYKLQTFLYLPASGIIQGMRPLIGYNFGAGEHRRVRSIYDVTLGLCAVIMAAGTAICFVFAGPLMAMFTDNPETISLGDTALRIISLGFIPSAVSVASSGALEGLGKGTQSFVISLFRYALVILPVAFVLSRIFGAVGVWHAFWITELATAAVSLIVYRKSVRQ